MSALGQKQTLGQVRLTSALPPKADIRWRTTHARPWEPVMIAAIQRDRSDIDPAEPFH
jgi:hypothetical protein